MAGWHHQLDGREFKWTPGIGDGQGGLACCNSWGHKGSDMTEQLNWTELNIPSIKKRRHHFLLKSRDINLPTNFHIVKAMVFPVLMDRYESQTINQAECRKIDALQLWRLLRVPFSKEVKPVNSKGDQLWIYIGRTDAEAEAQYFGYLMWRANSLEKTTMLGKIEGRRKRGLQRMRWLDSITKSTDMSKLQEIVKHREAWCDAVHGGHKVLDTTEQLNSNKINV